MGSAGASHLTTAIRDTLIWGMLLARRAMALLMQQDTTRLCLQWTHPSDGTWSFNRFPVDSPPPCYKLPSHT